MRALAIHQCEFASPCILPINARTAAAIPNMPAAIATTAATIARLRQPSRSTGSVAMLKKIAVAAAGIIMCRMTFGIENGEAKIASRMFFI